MSSFRAVSHIIFDLDGILLDTETIYGQTMQTIIEPYGKEMPWEVRSQLMGLKGVEICSRLVDTFELPLSYEDCFKSYEQLNESNLPNCELMKGAERLVCHLHCVEVPMAVATSSRQKSFDIKTRKHKEFFSVFDHIVCGGTDPEVKRGKPHPDVFLVCASRFPDKPKSEDCLVFEDSVNGVTAAMSAGMQCVMIPDPNVPADKRKATLILQSLEDFQPELFGLPAFT